MYAPGSFRWVRGLEGRLAGSGLPGSRQEVDWLIDQKIQAIVSLARIREDIERYLVEHCLDHLNFPVPDFEAPEPDDLPVFFEFVQSHLDRSKPVLVHCRAGVGRTSTLLSAFLIHTGAPMDEAVRRSGTEPESPEQIKFLRRLQARPAP